MSTMKGATREGRWDCDACSRKGIRGLERVCPGCGRPRPQTVKFYLPENAPEITDAATLQQVGGGPDWYCQHCGAGTSALRTTCRQCGAARGTSPSHKVTEYRPDEVPRSGDDAPQPVQPPSPDVTFADLRVDAHVDREPPSVGRNPAVLAGIAGGIIFIGLILAFLLRSPFTRVEVSGFSWERTITIEQLRTQTEQGWSIPAGGRPISETQALHHVEDVLDHYETRQRQVCETVQEGTKTESYEDCQTVHTGTESYVCGVIDNGDGTFTDKICERPIYERQCTTEYRDVPNYVKRCHDESYQHAVYRQEPRYATRYTYEIDRWVFSRTVQAHEQNHEASWPQPQLAPNEREAGRTETYTVLFVDKRGESYSYNCGLEEWSSYNATEQLQIQRVETGVIVKR